MKRYGPYFGFSHKISIIRYGSLFYDMSQILLYTSNIYFTIWENLIYDTRPLLVMKCLFYDMSSVSLIKSLFYDMSSVLLIKMSIYDIQFCNLRVLSYQIWTSFEYMMFFMSFEFRFIKYSCTHVSKIGYHMF